MKLSKALQEFEAASRSDDVFWIEEAKLNFALLLDKHCREANIKHYELADRLGTSSAYITKVFRGDANLTIESLVRFARALDLKLKIELEDETAAPQSWAWKNFYKHSAANPVRGMTFTTQDDFIDEKELAYG